MKNFICILMLLTAGLTARAQSSMSSAGMMTYTIAGVSNATAVLVTNVYDTFNPVVSGSGYAAVNGTYRLTEVDNSGTAYVWSMFGDDTKQIKRWGDDYTSAFIFDGAAQVYSGQYPYVSTDPREWTWDAGPNDPTPSIVFSGGLHTSITNVVPTYLYTPKKLDTSTLNLSSLAATNACLSDVGTVFFLHLTDNFDGTATATWNQTPY